MCACAIQVAQYPKSSSNSAYLIRYSYGVCCRTLRTMKNWSAASNEQQHPVATTTHVTISHVQNNMKKRKKIFSDANIFAEKGEVFDGDFVLSPPTIFIFFIPLRSNRPLPCCVRSRFFHFFFLFNLRLHSHFAKWTVIFVFGDAVVVVVCIFYGFTKHTHERAKYVLIISPSIHFHIASRWKWCALPRSRNGCMSMMERIQVQSWCVAMCVCVSGLARYFHYKNWKFDARCMCWTYGQHKSWFTTKWGVRPPPDRSNRFIHGVESTMCHSATRAYFSYYLWPDRTHGVATMRSSAASYNEHIHLAGVICLLEQLSTMASVHLFVMKFFGDHVDRMTLCFIAFFAFVTFSLSILLFDFSFFFFHFRQNVSVKSQMNFKFSPRSPRARLKGERKRGEFMRGGERRNGFDDTD